MRRLATILILAISVTLGASWGWTAPISMPGAHDCPGPVMAADECGHAHHRSHHDPGACAGIACCAAVTVLPISLSEAAPSGPGLRLSRALPPHRAHRSALSATDPPIPRHYRLAMTH